MLTYDELEKKTADFVERQTGISFSLDDAVAYCAEGTKIEDEHYFDRKVSGILDSFDTLARVHSDDNYYILERVLSGTQFLIRPRPFEFDNGILIPGVRFEPFHPEDIFYDELELSSGGKTFGLTDYETTYGEISDLYFLMGPGQTLDLLGAENQQNYENLRRANGLADHVHLNLEVFDLSEFYRETEFRSGDLIRVEVLSYFNGTYRLSHVKKQDSPGKKELDQWLSVFESALVRVCDDYGDSLEIPLQIMYAYLYAADAGKSLNRLPGVPIDDYHKQMRDVSFKRSGSEWCLASVDSFGEAGDDSAAPVEHEHHHDGECSCGHESHHDGKCSCGHVHDSPEVPAGLAPENFSASGGTMESLEGILRETDAPIHELELHALMLDTIASGSETFDEFLRIHEKYTKLHFADEAQEAAFLNFAEDLWEYTFENYAHDIDSLKAPLRASLIELMEKRIELSARLIAKKDKALYDEFSVELKELHTDMLNTFGVLNMDSALFEGKEFDDLELRIGDMEDKFEEISDKLDEKL